MTNWDELHQEWRESLPAVLEGKDPYRFDDWDTRTKEYSRRFGESDYQDIPRASAMPDAEARDAILSIVSASARRGEKIPTIGTLKTRVGVSKVVVRVAFRGLVDEGVLKVWGSRTSNAAHGVIIVATGERTA